MKNAALSGKPYAGNPHVRFDEGEVASAKPRRGSLLYSNEPNKPRELTEKELEGIVGGELMVTELVLQRPVQDALQQKPLKQVVFEPVVTEK